MLSLFDYRLVSVNDEHIILTNLASTDEQYSSILARALGEYVMFIVN